MGPCELMDLVGHDVNLAVTKSVWTAFFHDPRFAPSLVQQEMVDCGRLGRKSGRGFYEHGPHATPVAPATAASGVRPSSIVAAGEIGPLQALLPRIEDAGIAVRPGPADARIGRGYLLAGSAVVALTDGRTATERAATSGHPNLILVDLALDYAAAVRVGLARAAHCGEAAWAEAVGLFQAAGLAVSPLDDIAGLAVMRTVAMLANEAADAVLQGVATPEDVDVAMRKGVNYPLGPLAWADRLGAAALIEVIRNLGQHYGEDRYRVSPLLARKAFAKELFHDA
jgi:3-hydroxybutyryl-CoA dehydrogenase